MSIVTPNGPISPVRRDHLESLFLKGIGDLISTPTMWACIAALGVKPYKDGDMWCFLYGDNLQEGIFGSGQTIHQAAVDFYLEVMSSPAIIDDSTVKEEKKEVAVEPRFKVGDVVTFTQKHTPTIGKRIKYKVYEVSILPPDKGRPERVVYTITSEEPVPFPTIREVEEDELEKIGE